MPNHVSELFPCLWCSKIKQWGFDGPVLVVDYSFSRCGMSLTLELCSLPKPCEKEKDPNVLCSQYARSALETYTHTHTHTHINIARDQLRNAVEDGQRLCRRHCVPSLALSLSSISTFKMNGAPSEACYFGLWSSMSQLQYSLPLLPGVNAEQALLLWTLG